MNFTNRTGVSDPGPVLGILQKHVATNFDLFSQLKQAHWNLKGPNFIAVHEMLDGMADTVRGHVDTLAERMVSLGGYPMGDARSAANGSLLNAPSDSTTKDMEWVAFIADQFSAVSHELYKDIDATGDADPATQDLLIAMAQDVDKALYFLGSHMEK